MKKLNRAVLVVAAPVLVLAGCGGNVPLNIPTMSASAGRPQLQTDGAILVSASNLPANHAYAVGIFTNASPVKVGNTSTDGAGQINNVKLEYPCHSNTGVLATHAELYEPNGNDLGAGIVQTTISGDTCF